VGFSWNKKLDFKTKRTDIIGVNLKQLIHAKQIYFPIKKIIYAFNC
jgi:hypothetical protein